MPTPIENAREFVLQSIHEPALTSTALSDRTKDVLRSQKVWIERFNRVGDLWIYLNHFQSTNADDTVYQDLHAHGFNSAEDILPAFNQRFTAWLEDITTPDSFVVGRSVSPHAILSLARIYDTRAGGILPIESGGHIDAIVIKATLTGGKYPNAWLNGGNTLKYYFKSIGDTFKESYKENRAILNNPGTPIYAFVRDTPKANFIYKGVFYYQSHHTEADGAMWFELGRSFAGSTSPAVESTYLQDELDKQVAQSAQQPANTRQARLAAAPKKPQKVQVTSTGFLRNPDVIAETLARAEGICEACHQSAPFQRRKDNTPYLEVHHRIPLAEGGEDTVENALALCPNCHRKAHYG